LERAKEGKKELDQQRFEIAIMEGSNQKYSISLDGGIASQGLTTYNFGEHIVEMTIREHDNEYISHELKHGYQFETGDIALTNTAALFLDKRDEDAAYSVQKVWGSLEGYGFGNYQSTNLPDGPVNINNYGFGQIATSPTASGRLRTFLDKNGVKSSVAYRVNNNTYEILEEKH
jgi:hypothetical protein